MHLSSPTIGLLIIIQRMYRDQIMLVTQMNLFSRCAGGEGGDAGGGDGDDGAFARRLYTHRRITPFVVLVLN